MDKLDAYIEEVKQTKWMDKNDYLDREIDFEINGLGKVNDDVVLGLVQVGTTNEPEFVRASDTMRNDIIKKLGNNTDNWYGSVIKVKFEKFVPKEGSNISAGITCSLVSDKEEIIK